MKYIKIVLMISMGIAFRGYSQLWTSLDGGFSNPEFGGPQVFYMDEVNGSLLIGGGFWQAASGDTIAKVAKWNGSELMPMGCGFDWNCEGADQVAFGVIGAIIRFEGDLLASGGVQFSCGEPVNDIAKFNGYCWESFGPTNSTVKEFKIHNSELYACGIFECENWNCHGFGKWNGSTWLPVFELPNFSNNEIGNNVMTCEWYEGDLYLGGNWSYDGTDFNYDDMVMWNGEAWTPVGSGFSGSLSSVRKLTVFQDKLIAIGGFQGPNNPGNFIAAWDGESWDDMDGGLSNPNLPSVYYPVWDMWATEDYLYVVGGFAYAGGMPAHGIARWDGESWCGYGTGTEFNGFYWENVIHSVCIYNDELIIGGDFLAAEDHPNLNLLAKYIGPDSCLFTSVQALPDPSGIAGGHHLLVYPNPALSSISIANQKWKTGEEVQLHMYDVLGKMVLSRKVRYANPLEIDVSSLPAGTYAVDAACDGEHGVKWFVKE
jgi:hypothetical protein